MSRRIVITGLGIVSSVGNNPSEFFSNLLAGRSGISRIENDFSDRLNTRIAGMVKNFDPAAHFTKMQLTGMERFSQLAMVAARQAVDDSNFSLAQAENVRAGVFMGSCMGGASTLEEGYIEVFKRENPRIRPLSVLLNMNNAAASNISLAYQLQGANITYSTACASSAIAIGEAYRQIKHGYADVMFAGGSEAMLTFGAIKAWEALRTLAQEDTNDPATSCKPFSKDRSGLVLAEGAAVLILETAERAMRRGAKIYAEICGYECSSDATHITKPDAKGQARTMLAALRDAALTPRDIGYINAHGTATQVGDIQETLAIKEVFGEYARQIPISSTKSMHGHVMGATGAIEFMAAVQALHQQAIPPTINLHQPDPECDLDYVANVARREVVINAVMSNSFAFGGTNAVLIAQKFHPA